MVTEEQLIKNTILHRLVQSTVTLSGKMWLNILGAVQQVFSQPLNPLTKLARVSLMLNVSASNDVTLLSDISNVVPYLTVRNGEVTQLSPIQVAFWNNVYVRDRFNSFLEGPIPEPMMLVVENLDDSRYRGFGCLGGYFAICSEIFDDPLLGTTEESIALAELDTCTILLHEMKHIQIRMNQDDFLSSTPDLLAGLPEFAGEVLESGYIVERRVWGIVPSFFSPQRDPVTKGLNTAGVAAIAIVEAILTGQFTGSAEQIDILTLIGSRIPVINASSLDLTYRRALNIHRQEEGCCTTH